MRFLKNTFKVGQFLFSVLPIKGQEGDVHFKLPPVFNLNQIETLGLSFVKGVETFTIFSPQGKVNKYNHGVVLFSFKGMIYGNGKVLLLMKMEPIS